VLPLATSYVSPLGRAAALAERMSTLESFTFVGCDDRRGAVLERHGARVAQVCHYRAVTATETRYYSFWLASDGIVADFWSSTE
jgi:hypothetical protein